VKPFALSEHCFPLPHQSEELEEKVSFLDFPAISDFHYPGTIPYPFGHFEAILEANLRFPRRQIPFPKKRKKKVSSDSLSQYIPPNVNPWSKLLVNIWLSQC
jgi:hypothetical protein